ncbi:MAG TPA: hypothetical protein PKD80_13680 [Microthrixaceae bacterium]|jgi:hypothetical protein|nr:hypothetical protein [Microthrixaceae bacterium]HMT23136.1 hypothetical protein [Microthrixaceae bacterium]HMT59998.1 hypothetical protein [Microthrixaceae bacterium]
MTDDSPLTNRARSESSGDLHLITPADGSPRSGWTSNRLARAGAAVCAVVLVVGGALVVRDLGDDDSTESPGAAASSTGVDPSADPESNEDGNADGPAPTSEVVVPPQGFELVGQPWPARVARPDSTGSPIDAGTSGVVLGGGRTIQRAEVVGFAQTGPRAVRVDFRCVGGPADRLTEVAYERNGSTLRVDAVVEVGDDATGSCRLVGASVTLDPGSAAPDTIDTVVTASLGR